MRDFLQGSWIRAGKFDLQQEVIVNLCDIFCYKILQESLFLKKKLTSAVFIILVPGACMVFAKAKTEF